MSTCMYVVNQEHPKHAVQDMASRRLIGCLALVHDRLRRKPDQSKIQAEWLTLTATASPHLTWMVWPQVVKCTVTVSVQLTC